MLGWSGWTLLVVLSGLSACACGDGRQDLPREGSALHPGAERNDAGQSVAGTLTRVSKDPRVVALLAGDPDAQALRYLSETLLFTESEAEFITAMCTLSQSSSPQVAMVAAGTLSKGYHIATSAGFDIGGAIETSLRRRSPHLRRITVSNLGQFEAPEVRRWLQSRLEDTEVDKMDADGRTVAEGARAALEHLAWAKKEGLSVSPRDPRSMTVATVGTPLRAPIDDVYELLVEIESVKSVVASTSRLREPYVGATFTIVGRGTNFRVAVLRLESVSIYAGGWFKNENELLLVWCRPVAKDRVRCWYRAEVVGRRVTGKK
jgi:hypothetical protein